MPASPPLKWTEDTPEKAKHYLENYDSEEYGDVIPQISGLAVALGVHRDTIYTWCKDPAKHELSDTVRLIEEKQHKSLVNGSLTGKLNPTISKLLLSSNHGHSEKSEVKQEIKADIKTEITAVDNLASILAEYKKE